MVPGVAAGAVPARAPASGRPVLDIRALSKSFGKVTALDAITMSVAPGEVIGIVGPNGAGKSTLLSTICGLLRPDSGTVHVNGVDVRTAPRAVGRHVAVAAQEIGVYDTRTVYGNLVHFGRLAGLRRGDLKGRTEAVSDMLDLGALSRRKAAALSGGERRRLHVAIALLAPRPLLLLDEPTANADVETRAAIIGVVRALAADGVGICYATHYLSEIEVLEARVVMIDHGTVVASGYATDLVRRYGSAVVEVTLDEPLARPAEVAGCSVLPDGSRLVVRSESGEPSIPHVMRELLAQHASVRAIELRRPSLESVYLALRQDRQPVAVPNGRSGPR